MPDVPPVLDLARAGARLRTEAASNRMWGWLLLAFAVVVGGSALLRNGDPLILVLAAFGALAGVLWRAAARIADTVAARLPAPMGAGPARWNRVVRWVGAAVVPVGVAVLLALDPTDLAPALSCAAILAVPSIALWRATIVTERTARAADPASPTLVGMPISFGDDAERTGADRTDADRTDADPAAADAAADAGMPFDAIIVGGGHNGLTAAAYLARAGFGVLLLERDDHLGGAAVSAEAFEGVDARLSRYSYLVSLLPQRIIDDLGLDIRLVRRRISSYTPDPTDPTRGLLVDADAGLVSSAAAFERVDAEDDATAWRAFSRDTARVAEAIFPTLTEPLPTRDEARALVGDDRIWREFVERPLGEAIDSRFQSDLVRGVIATDGLIGTFTDLDDPSLDANRCFLYHVIGGGTGDWDVPVGGMGAVTGELARAAREAGAVLRTGAEVLAISPDGTVRWAEGGADHVAEADTVLANVAPVVLDRLVTAGSADAPGAGPSVPPTVAERLRALATPEGAQVKVNLLLTRLPRLRDREVRPEDAFAGTFHINETASQLDAAYAAAARGVIPSPLPCEIYCHTLSDPSILGRDLAASGAHTLTVFGLHVPDRLVERYGNDRLRDLLEDAVLDSLDSVLAEPIRDVIATDASGRPCIEVKTTHDLEEALAMPGGNIFHGPLSWPWAEPGASLATPAERWGVATRYPNVLLSGSGAVRGGAVSGIGGHNAAMAVIEELRG